MDPFNPIPAPWTKDAIHALEFCCPNCKASPDRSERVWLNRRSPIVSEDYRRQWQEFYKCECGQSWWAWSGSRPPSELNQYRDNSEEN